MRELVPYKTYRGAKKALDSGGRFFNLLAQAGDDRVDAAELARAAGVYTTGAKAFLHFEMALMELSTSDRDGIISLLSPDLRRRYQAQRPSILAPSVVESQGQVGKPAIVSGYPVFVEDRTEFKGFIMLVTPTIMMIPIIDQFDVYEVFDSPDMNTPRTVIATTRGSKRLDGLHARFGGMLRELHFEDKTAKDHGLYLEAVYYTLLAKE